MSLQTQSAKNMTKNSQQAQQIEEFTPEKR